MSDMKQKELLRTGKIVTLKETVIGRISTTASVSMNEWCYDLMFCFDKLWSQWSEWNFPQEQQDA